MKFQVKAENKTKIKSVIKALEKGKEKGIGDATRYLWKAIRRSVKKRDSDVKKRRKTYDLKIMVGKRNYERNHGSGRYTYETEVNATDYLNNPKRNYEKIVMGSRRRDQQKSTRTPLTQGTLEYYKNSAPGKPPFTHKARQKGWYDHWLKRSILFDAKAGMVYVNPATKTKDVSNESIPQLLEEGGQSIARWKMLIGYYAHKTYMKNGKVNVMYTARYKKYGKRFNMQPRPFMRPMAKKLAPELVAIMKGSIIKKLENK